MKNLLLILGNGYTIDYISSIGKADEIDVKNLFHKGHTVKFPDNGRPGFLSYKYCPSLWLLGARPNKGDGESMAIIEEIITCSNMLFEYLQLANKDSGRLKLIEADNQSIYIKAYSELIAYLKYLFIEYNSKISDKEIEDFLGSNIWGWAEFFRKAYINYDKINIITYNYDIWLERIFDALGITYSVVGFDAELKVNIIKPHGSISFIPKSGKNILYRINYTIDADGTDIDQLRVDYNDLEQYDKSFLIPPAGDSSRQLNNTWAKKLRKCALEAVKSTNDLDDVFICGMSYWHVDRKELDELLINLNQNVNLSLINPNPPKDLNAVLVSLFKNYTVFTSSDIFKEELY